MSSSVNPVVPDISQRRAPGLGGFNLTALGLEIRRFTRNRRTIIFALVVPIALFLLVGLNKTYVGRARRRGQRLGVHHDQHRPVRGRAVDHGRRRDGVHRAGRGLEPPAPADAAVPGRLHRHQAAAAMVLGMVSVVAVFIIGRATGKPDMPAGIWVATGFSVWVGSLVFAAFGLLLGYLLPTENVMQFLGLIVGLLGFAGGLFVPISQFPSVVQDIAKLHAPLRAQSAGARAVAEPGRGLDMGVNVVIWLAIFAMRRDLAVPHGHRAGLACLASDRLPTAARRAARPGIRSGGSSI